MIVAFERAHAAGFRELVVQSLAEYGFEEDPVLDADLADPTRHYDAVWVVADERRVVGSVAMRLLAVQEAELKRMYVLPTHRGRGLGRLLLEHALDWAATRGVRAVRLDTSVEMVAARRLYESAGFRRTGERIESGAFDRRRELLYALELPARRADRPA